MIPILIFNMRDIKPTQPWDFRIDRHTILGNPSVISPMMTRVRACYEYEVYFQKQVQSNERFKKKLDKMIETAIKYRQLNLICWCEPEACHGRTIKRYIEQELKAKNIVL